MLDIEDFVASVSPPGDEKCVEFVEFLLVFSFFLDAVG
jgi:hypothetical protein